MRLDEAGKIGKIESVKKRDDPVQEDETVDYAKESLRLHYEWKGKLEVTAMRR